MSIDQAHQLRQLVRGIAPCASTSAPPLVIVSGGKGGVGASTIALELSKGIARTGRRVVLVEADLHRTSTSTCAVEGGSLIDVLTGRMSAADALVHGPDGIQILPAAWASREVIDCTATMQQRLLTELSSLDSHADVIVIDIGSSRSHFVRRFWQSASLVLMVATPDVAAVTDAYAAIKVLLAGDTSVPVYTLVNFSTLAAAAERAHERLAATCRRFLGLRTTPLGEIPRDFGDNESTFDLLATAVCEELALNTPANQHQENFV